MTRAASPAPMLVGALWISGLGGLAAISWVYPAATRMYAWPWSIAYAFALVGPALVLLCRTFDRRRPLVLPARAWTAGCLLAAGTVLFSALASPYRSTSLLWSAPLLAGVAQFFAVFDWLHADSAATPHRRRVVLAVVTAFLATIAAAGLAVWFFGRIDGGLAVALAGRNDRPLGHSNYTAGLALLIIPCAAGFALTQRGFRRAAGATAALVGLAVLFSSGSRGGVAGLAVAALTALTLARLPGRTRWIIGVLGAAAGLMFVAANPRTRAMLEAPPADAAPNESNVQRSAMLAAAGRMGLDRPLLGWGPGTTPLAYPRYRAGLAGGAENVLQLHSTPAQVWAELGGAGVLAAAILLGLGVGAARREPAAAVALAGYGAFALFDWQLDVPLFGFATATLGALLPAPAAVGTGGGRGVGMFTLGCLAAVVSFGQRDPAPRLNTEALTAAATNTPEGSARATRLLRESLALNPDQEIAHFNLGWLLVTSEPAVAERHFLAAAHLVPDKGGVYFGLGLARLNQGRSGPAARAMALEVLNDPAFLHSPWWSVPEIGALRGDTILRARADLLQLRPRLPAGSWPSAQWLRVTAALEARQPDGGRERAYRRERTGYPVLMRNLDLPTPVDVFVVREYIPAPGTPDRALPAKGWLPSPQLLALLDDGGSTPP